MQISSIQGYSLQDKKINPQFKKAYPVVHWVAESNSSYAPTRTLELTKKLQRKLVSILNNSIRLKPTIAGKQAIDYLAKNDTDYRGNENSSTHDKFVRTYYDKSGGFNEYSGKYLPYAYLITGNDAYTFDEKYGKPLGRAKNNATWGNGTVGSAELNIAKTNYFSSGWKFVNDSEKKIYDENKVEQALHTKFETVRNNKGDIVDFKLVDIRFCPEKGENNPFVRAGYIKAENL